MPRERTGKKPGLFVPTIDMTKCEGGYHGDCAAAKCPCIEACPHRVLEIRRLTKEEKKHLSLGGCLRAWIHGNQQAHIAKEDACTACARCVEACPVQHVIKLRRRT